MSLEMCLTLPAGITKWSREELDQIRNAGVLPQYYGLSLAAPSEPDRAD
ncbi:hypothetical protein [Enterobacter phage 03_vB_Eclo_IJM]|nr:hypothetical protein [Enterobacter phage 03_vB_Eclo_IJM]